MDSIISVHYFAELGVLQHLVEFILLGVTTLILLLSLRRANAWQLLRRNKVILLVVFAFSIFGVLCEAYNGPAKKISWYFGAFYFPWENIFSLVIFITGFAFFTGLLTKLLLAVGTNGNAQLLDCIKSFWTWFPRSLVLLFISWGGIIFSLIIASSPWLWSVSGVAKVFHLVTTGLWVAITFPLFPLVLHSKERLARSLVDAFTKGIKDGTKWFHLVLLLLVLSGGLTYVWLPLEVIKASNYQGPYVWYNIQWLGGFSFGSVWHEKYFQVLGLQPSWGIRWLLFFLNSLIAVVMKIQLLKILHNSGELSLTHSETFYFVQQQEGIISQDVVSARNVF
jgi:hypothetical protein